MELEIGEIIRLTGAEKIYQLDAEKRLYEYSGYKLEMLNYRYDFQVIGYADSAPDNPLPFDDLPPREMPYYYYGRLVDPNRHK